MHQLTISNIDIEGSTETVTVFYQDKLIGSVEIVDVCCGTRRVRHLLTPLQLRQIRLEIFNALSSRSFFEYQKFILGLMQEGGMAPGR